MSKILLAGAAALAFSFVPASASPLGRSLELAAVAADTSAVEQVQYRRWNRGHRHGYRRGGWGGGAGLGIGLATGAIIGGAIASSQARGYYGGGYARGYDDTVAYCSQRYRSYDPDSGTYLGYDGLRHPCP